MWSAIPKRSPWTFRRAFGAVLSVVILTGAVLSAARAVPAMVRVLRLHVLGGALSAAFVAGVALGVLVAVAAAALVFWYSVRDSRNSVDFRAYLDQYSVGAFVKLAQNRLAELEKAAREAEDQRR